MFRIQDICDSLKMSVMVCQNARDNLHTAQKLFTTASLGILSNYRKRKIILELLKSLNTIKTLVCTMFYYFYIIYIFYNFFFFIRKLEVGFKIYE